MSDLAPGASTAGQRILLVEDSDVVRMLTVEVLEELDYRVTEAGEAQQALQILRSDEPIDLLMPGRNWPWRRASCAPT